MCNPIAMMAIMAVSKAAEISATNQAMEAEQKAAVSLQTAMNTQRTQEREESKLKVGMKLSQEQRAALRSKSTVRALSASSGVSGGSPLRNLVNTVMQSSITSGSIVSLGESDIVRISTESQADYLKTVNTINIAESQKTTGLSAALQIGVAGAQGYGAGGGFEAGTTFSEHWDKALS